MAHDKYTPRRATQRWLEGAPAHVLDVIADQRERGEEAPGWIILFTGPLLLSYDRNGAALPAGQRGRYADTFVQYLDINRCPTSPNMGVSLWGELSAYNAAQLRYRGKGRRTRWMDLPADIRAHIEARSNPNEES